MENNEAYALPDLSSTPIGDLELVEEHLRPGHRRYMSERRSGCQAGVNAGHPHMNPWELIPEVTRQEERREKYFFSTNIDLSRHISTSASSNVEAPQGYWKPRGITGWAIQGKVGCDGYKMTYDFYTRTRHPSRVDTKTNWIMNVYALLDHDNWIQNDMVLCHVFENNSPDYDPRPRCSRFREVIPAIEHHFANLERQLPKRSCGSCSYEHSGKPCNEAIHGPSSSSFRGTAPGPLSTHHGSDRPSDPRLTTYMAELEKVMLGDDPEISTDAGNYNPSGCGLSSTVIPRGQSRKRARAKSKSKSRTSSDVWQRFTKVFAHGPDGVVTLAACNHCYKVLKGDSEHLQ